MTAPIFRSLLPTCAAAALLCTSAFAQEATETTQAYNEAFAADLPWGDDADFERAARGFIATRENPLITTASGGTVVDLSAYDFAEGDAPDTVNPSLWRHLQLLRQHGLYEVVPGLWQVRGFDLSVMSIIRTDTGYVIVDPLLARETSAAAMELVRQELGDLPVHAVIYTHSHADHFGGVKGVVSEDDVNSGRTQIIAPHGFMEHAVSENLLLGPAMRRRAVYQFGQRLDVGTTGHAGNGIGATIARGTRSLIPPTISINETGETLTIDGMEFVFQVTPGAEAPAEMNFFLPSLNALCLAENANPTMHNVLTPRGALVRDALAWADYLTESLRLWGDEADVVFTSHGWPRWGEEDIYDYMSSHRDAYKFLHDQSVRLMNLGYTEMEIAEQIELPPSLARQWFNRGYYGTMSHNSKAVYQRYMGWYDGNPANLNPLPPEEAGSRYVEAMGGADAALSNAQSAYEEGDYRWAAQLASHIVFDDASNMSARELLAAAFEQMGYQAEGMLWRNMYLTGAQEVITPPPASAAITMSGDFLAATPSADLFDILAAKIDPARSGERALTVRFVFNDRDESHLLSLRNSVLVHETGVDDASDVTLTMPRSAFMAVLFAGQPAGPLVDQGTIAIDGDVEAFNGLLASLEDIGNPEPFSIVLP
ncbi:alkyl sulfatase dimerization domain-containing protein [Ponticaulis sp.]|uniref:alkyl/aryl-sulfatase n=1 Tax=Ponticaulis sp. TaxID=2020902 RepID=UPI000B6A1634|nr:alkyl sulfatase dimerization domain-containing protein [Ponticaulis sp.]MAI89089.1 alkyl/aryl-sulfatase [Ponticaulis sp.]OUY01372.1 MAG: alkyl/aryl-sulfatase [Hyphomonadaceae bacterium TMED5]|tara:strand:- start:13795 stop:15753 length:1959 start_codon:yes stop_codon:yes gene_type:complete